MDFLLPLKYFVVPDTGWSRWDLKVSRGLWSRALVTVCSENHGGLKRLLRVRCAMRVSSLARVLLRVYAAAAAGSLILDAPAVAVFFCVLGLFNLGVIGWRLIAFSRLMHRIIEAVASQARLAPAKPMRPATLPIGEPRTA
jgi:O-antigen biosynthesis protein